MQNHGKNYRQGIRLQKLDNIDVRSGTPTESLKQFRTTKMHSLHNNVIIPKYSKDI